VSLTVAFPERERERDDARSHSTNDGGASVIVVGASTAAAQKLNGERAKKNAAAAAEQRSGPWEQFVGKEIMISSDWRLAFSAVLKFF
jgi:hypothetical protein